MKALQLALLIVLVALAGCSTFSFNQSVTLNRYTTRTEVREAPAAEAPPAATALVIPPNSQQPVGKVEIVEQSVKKTELALTPAPIKTTQVVLCPTYQPPSLARVPELPYKELQALGPTQTEQVDELERRHIDELRAYITKLRSTVLKSHQRYLESCRAHLQKSTK